MVRRKLLVLGIVLIAALGAPSAKSDILIGVATPLTGPVAWAGGSNLTGAEIAVGDLNAQAAFWASGSS